MQKSKNVRIIGSGIHLPNMVRTSNELEDVLNLEHGWTEKRTGIKTRRVSGDCSLIDLYVNASVEAVRNASRRSVDHITICQDYSGREVGRVFGSVCDAMSNIGVETKNASFAMGFPHCAGYVSGLKNSFYELKNTKKENALVVGASKLFDCFNPVSPETSVLWGDGAGALVLSSQDAQEGLGLLYFKEITSPEQYFEFTHSEDGHPYVKMDGKGVYKFVIRNVPNLIRAGLSEASEEIGEDIGLDKISLFLFHQANKRMIQAVQEELGLPQDRFLINVDTLGNTGVASIPIAYHQARCDGRVRPGEYYVICGFGVGMQANMALIKA
jgi:3-oxoacyl-[acyl-carrier-protein] synthase-3